MNLVTVTSPNFLSRAINLVFSYKKFFSKRCLIFYFGDIEKKILQKLETFDIECYKIENVCGHAHDPHFYFFKSYALWHGYSFIKDDFIYLDSAFVFNNFIPELVEKLQTNQRVFISYPKIEEFKLKYWSTKRCQQLLECNSEYYENSFKYWAAIQAYKYNDFNTRFIETNYNAMLNPEIAGPSNIVIKPDGPDSWCIAHRNDQSALSLLIAKFKIEQPFDDFSAKYCDIDTLARPEFRNKINFNYISQIHATSPLPGRQSQICNIPPELLKVL